MQKVAIFGAAGTIGAMDRGGTGAARRSVPVVGRDARRLEAPSGMRQAESGAKPTSPTGRTAADAARGVDTVIYCGRRAVPAVSSCIPASMRTAIEGAAAAGVARMAVVSSVYSYGAPRTRASPKPTRASRIRERAGYRKEQEDIALEAHARGLLRTLVVRLPDFYGPHAENSLAHEVFRAALAGKTANWLGPVSTPHEFIFVPDAGRADRGSGLARGTATAKPGTSAGRARSPAAGFIQKVYRAAGREPKFRAAGRTMLRARRAGSAASCANWPRCSTCRRPPSSWTTPGSSVCSGRCPGRPTTTASARPSSGCAR